MYAKFSAKTNISYLLIRNLTRAMKRRKDSRQNIIYGVTKNNDFKKSVVDGNSLAAA